MKEAPALRIPRPAFLDWPELRQVLLALPEARIVGGAVRDALIGRPVSDVDLATPQPPASTAKSLTEAGLRAVPTGLAHGTVTAIVRGRAFEITTLRRDVETDGRHAIVAFTDDWREDAARRDFTINALSMSPEGDVFDYFGGIGDLRAGNVRFVGNAARRIQEDYLRILRFFRFFARYGRGEPDAEAISAIQANVKGLAGLSAERVWSELKRILSAEDPRAALRLMAEAGVLAALLPEELDLAALERFVTSAAPADPLLRLAALLGEGGSACQVAARLKLSNAERDHLLALRSGPAPGLASTEADLRRLLADEPADVLIARSWLVDGSNMDAGRVRNLLRSLPPPVFPLSGRDVLAAGVPSGPQVGELLHSVREWWLEGGCVADAAACRARLAELLRQRDALPKE